MCLSSRDSVFEVTAREADAGIIMKKKHWDDIVDIDEQWVNGKKPDETGPVGLTGITSILVFSRVPLQISGQH